MNKWLVAVMAMAAISVVPSVSRGEFGLPKVGGGGADLDGFLNSAADAETLMRKSSWHLAQAVLSKEQVEKLQETRNAIEKTTDPKEKEAKLRELDKDTTAELAKVDYAAKSKEIEKEQDGKKKERTAAGVYNFALGALKDTELLAQGQKLATTPPSPAIATKLPRVKEVVTNLSGQVDAIGKVAKGLKSLAPAVGLKALPTKASEKPKDAAD